MALTVSTQGETTVLGLSGELDIEQVQRIVERVLDAVDVSPGPVVVDADSLTFVDSMGLGLLLEIRNHAQHGMSIRNAPSRLVRVAKVSGLLEVLGLVDQ